MKSAHIILSNGQVTVIDEEDYEEMSKYKWHALNNGLTTYVVNNDGYYMHRMIMDPEIGLDTHHIDHNALNNKKANLRSLTRAEHACYRRPYKTILSKNILDKFY